MKLIVFMFLPRPSFACFCCCNMTFESWACSSSFYCNSTNLVFCFLPFDFLKCFVFFCMHALNQVSLFIWWYRKKVLTLCQLFSMHQSGLLQHVSFSSLPFFFVHFLFHFSYGISEPSWLYLFFFIGVQMLGFFFFFRCSILFLCQSFTICHSFFLFNFFFFKVLFLQHYFSLQCLCMTFFFCNCNIFMTMLFVYNICILLQFLAMMLHLQVYFSIFSSTMMLHLQGCFSIFSCANTL